MSEAENKVLSKWRKYLAKSMTLHQYHPTVSDGLHSIESYKAALRREIEKLIDFETEGSEWDAAIDTVLKLLDTVEP